MNDTTPQKPTETLEEEIARLRRSDNEWDKMRAANLEKWGRAK